jgi:hypothetical protein
MNVTVAVGMPYCGDIIPLYFEATDIWEGRNQEATGHLVKGEDAQVVHR